MTEEQTIPQPPPASFANVLEVLGYLKGEGWKVSKDTLYRGVKDGKLRPDESGAFTREAVAKYAAAFLVKAKTRAHVKDEELSRRAREAEIELKSQQARLVSIKLAEREGLLVPRDQWDRELAARAGVLESGLKGWIQDRAAEWVAVVSGDQALVADLVRAMHQDLDRALNEYAATREFHVLFEADNVGGE